MGILFEFLFMEKFKLNQCKLRLLLARLKNIVAMPDIMTGPLKLSKDPINETKIKTMPIKYKVKGEKAPFDGFLLLE